MKFCFVFDCSTISELFQLLMQNLRFVFLGIHFHSPHPLIPPPLHLINRVKQLLLVTPIQSLLELHHLTKHLPFAVFPRKLRLQLLHLLLKFTILSHRHMIQHVVISVRCVVTDQ